MINNITDMKKILDWFKQSNRWKHLAGGFVIGIGANSNYCAAYAAVIAGLCLEYKDKAHGGEWDWIDLGLTVGGAVLGRGIRLLVELF